MSTAIWNRSKAWLLACLAGSIFLGCNNNTSLPPLPEAPVWVELDLNSDAKRLRDPLSYMLLTHPRVASERLGHKGVVVVNGLATAIYGDGQSQNYAAYDLVCPNDWPIKVRLEVKSPGLSGVPLAECPKCKRQYDITLGTGIDLNSKDQPVLISYPVVRYGDRLLIRNRK